MITTTKAEGTLYLTGSAASLGSWRSTGVRLQKLGDGRHHATVELMTGIQHAFCVMREGERRYCKQWWSKARR